MKTDSYFMQLAIEKARVGVTNGQSPFGACIVKQGQVIACEHNQVWANTDISAHAEVVAIRIACQKLQTIDLSGSMIYTTCEPCPMCLSTCHWARLDKIVYGTDIAAARAAGFHELNISAQDMKQLGKSEIVVEGGFMEDESFQLLQEWSARPDKKSY